MSVGAKLRSDARAWIGGSIICALILMALCAPLIARHNPLAVDLIDSLGLGVQPPTPSWGAMTADGRDLYQLRTAPWTSLAPGLAIAAAVLGFNLVGDALRDALDPRAVRAVVPDGGGSVVTARS